MYQHLQTFADHDTSAPRSVFAITPGSGVLKAITRAIYVGGAGDMTVEMVDGSSATFTAVPAGSMFALRAAKVTAATATGLVGLY